MNHACTRNINNLYIWHTLYSTSGGIDNFTEIYAIRADDTQNIRLVATFNCFQCIFNFIRNIFFCFIRKIYSIKTAGADTYTAASASLWHNNCFKLIRPFVYLFTVLSGHHVDSLIGAIFKTLTASCAFVFDNLCRRGPFGPDEPWSYSDN